MIGVGFGLAGTLIEDRGVTECAFKDMVRQYASRVPSHDDVAQSCRHLQELFEGGLPVEAAATAALEALLGKCSIPADAGMAFRRAQRRAVESKICAYPDVATVLNTLAEFSIPMAVLTNGWYGLEAAKAARIGFQGPVVVPPYARWIPAPGAYETLAGTLNVPLDHVWYISSSEDAIAGARACGMNAIHVDRRVRPLESIFEEIAPAYTRAALVLRQLLISRY
ncbi:MAG: hypothetical protein NVSMB31_11080 [Vulcanimicrobiaceae bacterium]